MLNDKNFTVLLYEQNGASIFPNTEIKGGVAITLRNKNREYGEIGVFTAIPILNYIIKKLNCLILDFRMLFFLVFIFLSIFF